MNDLISVQAAARFLGVNRRSSLALEPGRSVAFHFTLLVISAVMVARICQEHLDRNRRAIQEGERCQGRR